MDWLLKALGSYLGSNTGVYNTPMMPAVKGASTTSQSPAPVNTTPKMTYVNGGEKFPAVGTNNNPYQAQQGGGVQQPQAPQEQQSNGQDLAMMAYRAAIDQAGSMRSSGKATFDDLLKSISGFRDRSKTQFADAGQQIINTSAENLNSNATNADDMRGQARARGRAMGLGDSSKFGLQNKIDANLASTQGNVLAKRGENERANQNVYDERLGQADSQEGQANSFLRGINDSASAVESAGVQNYGGALDNILNYQRSLQALQPLNAGGLTQMSPDFSGIQNTLNGILSGVGGRQAQGGDMAGNLSNSVDYASLLDPRKRALYQG